jgi:hypothetical protein
LKNIAKVETRNAKPKNKGKRRTGTSKGIAKVETRNAKLKGKGKRRTGTSKGIAKVVPPSGLADYRVVKEQRKTAERRRSAADAKGRFFRFRDSRFGFAISFPPLLPFSQ